MMLMPRLKISITFQPTCWILLLGRPDVSCSQLNCCFCLSFFPIQTTYTITCQLVHFSIQNGLFEYYFFIFFFIYLQHVPAYQLIKYHRGCDAQQATAKIVQPCIFSHEISRMHGKVGNSLTKLLWACHFFTHHYITHNKTRQNANCVYKWMGSLCQWKVLRKQPK